MKKLITIVAACLVAVSLYGCGSSNAATTVEPTTEPTPTAYTGTQEASVQGMGKVTVTITFEDGVVTACEVDASNETDSIGQVAAPTVAQEIIDNNSPEVDGVSGATMTSNATKEAAQACFDAAGIAY